MEDHKEHIVIIGGGFGGISVAKKLEKVDAKVTIIDKSNHHLFQPLLYQVATAAVSPADIAMPIRRIFRQNKAFEILLAEVVSIDKQANSLTLSDKRTIDFDKLVIATGSQYNYFGNDDWPDHAPSLKSIADALEIRERILLSLEEADQIADPEERKPYLTFVVVGGGPTGVETSGAIAEIVKNKMMKDYSHFNSKETRIFLVEAADSILAGYPESLSKKAQHTLENMGVQVLLNQPVKDVNEGSVSLGGETIETPNQIWAAGVAAPDFLRSLNAKQDKTNRVKVGPQLTLPDHPNIFVIGDSAHFQQDGKPLPALAPVAMQQGKYVGKLLAAGKDIDQAESFNYFDKGTMATIGRAKAVADIRGFTFSGFFAWLLWAFVHIFTLIGFRNRARIFGEWMWLYLTFDRGVRLITSRFNKRDEMKGVKYVDERKVEPKVE